MELNKYHFTQQSTILTFGVYMSSKVLNLCHMGIPDGKFVLFSCLAVGTGIVLDRLFKPNKYDKLFRMCNLTNKEDKTAIVIKEQKKDNITTLVLHLPEGLSQDDFEKKQQALEQNLNAKITFGFNKNLVMKMVDMNLKTMYPYEFRQLSDTEAYIGKGYEDDFILDISKDQHLIVAGETEAGKSSFLVSMLLSYSLSKHNIELHLIDFQDITLCMFKYCKKVKSYGTTIQDFDKLMDYLETESERRLKLFKSVNNSIFVEKIETWNRLFPARKIPFIAVVIDEGLTLGDYPEVMKKFRQRVAKDRKCGIHYILSLQRPSADIVAGSIKSNMSTRIAFKCVSKVDSEVILGGIHGAEKIKHRGRFLARYRGELKEYQALYIDPDKIKQILKDNGLLKDSTEVAETSPSVKKTDRKTIIADFHKNYKNPYKKDVAQ
jgi:S-DNA-T family DNA segregation ATPase FtsK/SpoIIIE